MILPHLEVRGISKIYQNQGTPVSALQTFSMKMDKGEWISILGPSGSGKSTLLRIIAGLETASSGEIFSDGLLIDSVPAHKRNFVMMFQQPALFPTMTVRENIQFGLRMRKIPNDLAEEKVSEMISMTKLLDLGGRYPHELSGGQQQRVALARALVCHPKLLLLDEPLSNLDSLLKEEILSDLQKLHQTLKLSILWVTHDESEAKRVSSRILRLSV